MNNFPSFSSFPPGLWITSTPLTIPVNLEDISVLYSSHPVTQLWFTKCLFHASHCARCRAPTWKIVKGHYSQEANRLQEKTRLCLRRVNNIELYRWQIKEINSFFFLNCIYFFGCIGSLLLRVSFLQLWQVGATLRCSARAFHCGGFSCCGAQAIGTGASVGAAYGLSSCSMWALEHMGFSSVAHRLSSCGAWA